MLASLLVAGALAAGPMKIRVEVLEYYTHKKVAGARVTLREKSGTGPQPVELQGVTDAKGRAWFDVPHLDFTPVEISKEGYVPRQETEFVRHELGVMEGQTARGEDELYLDVRIVSRAWWEANVKARTPEQAAAIAAEWGRECGPGAPTSVEYKEKERAWSVRYPCMEVLVRPKTGGEVVRFEKPVTATPLYPPEEALADALSSPLEFIGISHFDAPSIQECAYRNQKVLVVNRYCTTREITATGITIIHPDRGVVRFYAEAKEPISTIAREDYDNWRMDTHDPYPGARLTMKTFEEIQAHEKRRGVFRDQACYAGITSTPNGSCRKKAPEIEQWWSGIYKPLLKTPPESWYSLVKALRKRAVKDGRPDIREKG